MAGLTCAPITEGDTVVFITNGISQFLQDMDLGSVPTLGQVTPAVSVTGSFEFSQDLSPNL